MDHRARCIKVGPLLRGKRLSSSEIFDRPWAEPYIRSRPLSESESERSTVGRSVCILGGWSGPMDGPDLRPPPVAVSRAMATYSPLLISPYLLLLTLLPSSSSSFSSLPPSPTPSSPPPLRNTSLYPVCTGDDDCDGDKKCFQYMCYPWQVMSRKWNMRLDSEIEDNFSGRSRERNSPKNLKSQFAQIEFSRLDQLQRHSIKELVSFSAASNQSNSSRRFLIFCLRSLWNIFP